MPTHWKGQSVDMRYNRCGIDLKEGNGMDFSDSKHSLAELAFQGATESESMQDFSEEAKKALRAWRNRSVPRLSGAELLQMPGCSVFSITYEGQAGEYWPNERENEMTETLIRDFLYRDGIGDGDMGRCRVQTKLIKRWHISAGFCLPETRQLC